jgi:hypothetical protein
MPSAGFERLIPAIEKLQTYALDRTFTGFVLPKSYQPNNISYNI